MKSLQQKINESIESQQVNEARKFTAYALGIGKVNLNTGVTGHGWNIYDNGWGKGMEVYYTGSHLIFSTEGSFKKGDDVTLRHNDTSRKLKEVFIVDVCKCEKDEILKMLKKDDWDFYPKRPFAKKSPGARDNSRFGISYSIKGIE
jgi:hypothetical protein